MTLITRPGRFGKTLNMSMTEQFFSLKYANRGNLFEGLAIWKEEEYRKIQGTYPVISLSFANIKERDYLTTGRKICQMMADLYADYTFLLNSDVMEESDREFFRRISVNMGDVEATLSLHNLCKYISRYYGKKVIILLDEYDTPMQEAYVDGYWDDLVAFTRSLFNSTFKTNPWLERGIMTGITRVSKESIFSDLNNLKVVTTTSAEYATSFGFTEEEVFAALEECGLFNKKEEVKRWYDGFIFGNHKDIYNPWSILNFLDTESFGTYWANTSANSLVGKLLREGDQRIKEEFEIMLKGGVIQSPIDEQIVYNQLRGGEAAIWSLLLASGYLKVLSYESILEVPNPQYTLALTNLEVKLMFQNMIHDWFTDAEGDYNDFIQALFQGDVDAMNEYMNNVALSIFSHFDTGKHPSGEKPERFYHGFVLGLMVDLQGRYVVTSNRESGFGRYDVMLELKNTSQDRAFILEFKVFNSRIEKSLEDTVASDPEQIDKKKYEADLVARGIPAGNIRK